MTTSLKGILSMCIGVFFLALGDAVAKWLGEVHSPLQIIFFRTLISLPLIALLAHFWEGCVNWALEGLGCMPFEV